MLGLLNQVDAKLARDVADELGLTVPKKPEQPINHSIPADGNPSKFQPKVADQGIERSDSLSMEHTKKDSIITRKIAILAANGVDGNSLQQMKKALTAEGAVVEIIAPKLGTIKDAKAGSVNVDKNLRTVASVLYDAVFVPGGKASAVALAKEPDAIHFIDQAYKHCKAIAMDSSAEEFISRTYLGVLLSERKTLPGVVYADKNKSQRFIDAIAQHRFWEREKLQTVPA
jgi:catalase